MTYVYTSFAALCDFTVGILPIFIVLQLKMPRQTKIAVAGILGMACM
jgi:xanthosine utilization system XapX-like protein